jgi:hypothetical protein
MPTEQAKGLPKRALESLHLGQSFAEYDSLLTKSSVFVHTSALNAANDHENPHCFFVGRRGTGKTTITRFVEANEKNVIVVRPEIFSPSSSLLELDSFRDANQRPFRSLTSAFRRTLQDEVLFSAHKSRPSDVSQLQELNEEFRLFADHDFDLRALAFIEELTTALVSKDDPSWVKKLKLPKTLGQQIDAALQPATDRYTVLVDAIDESWDGSELAVIYLAAMMHACLEINSHNCSMRVLMFLRENIFERVRLIDTEFARLETCVVGLDWSDEQLLELVERRLNAGLTSKYPLGGTTWDMFFEDGPTARQAVFGYCQSRPRDVLTYCSLALDTAQSHKHPRILIEDLLDARRRFSDSRLSDLGDEYQENYPQIAVVLSKFYGLGQRWTLPGMATFLERLLDDPAVTSSCASWIYRYSAPEQFVRLLYEIGFVGLQVLRRDGDRRLIFRSLGPRDTTPPPIDDRTDISVHPTYWDALDLQDVLVTEFGEGNEFGRFGLVTDFPGALNLQEYQESLRELNEKLKNMPTGPDAAADFESAVGRVIELCFFRTLFNLEAQSKDSAGTIRRDWIVSNRGESGFWHMVRIKYGATQVIFECKNYEDLSADDFHQASYYMTPQAGKLVIVVFRGEIRNHYYDHIRKVSADGGLVLPLNDRDLRVFVRQATNGRVKDSHLQDKYDKVVRAIS